MVIRLFDVTLPHGRSRFHVPVRTLAVNLGLAVCCALLGIAYFAVSFAAGEVDRPTPFGSVVFLWSMGFAVAALGAVVSATLKRFPWIAVFLTPLLLGLMMTLPGDPDGFSLGLRMGCITSAVFLLGASAVRGFRAWVRMRKPVGRV